MAYSGLEFVPLGYVDSMNSTLSYAKCTSRTVDNEAFGVKGGTQISMIIFKLVSTIPPDLYMWDFDQGTFEWYPQLAQGIVDAVDKSDVLKSWLSETD